MILASGDMLEVHGGFIGLDAEVIRFYTTKIPVRVVYCDGKIFSFNSLFKLICAKYVECEVDYGDA